MMRVQGEGCSMPTTETESSKAVRTPLSKRHPRLLMTPFSCSVKAFVAS
jgi:hypothetical protein